MTENTDAYTDLVISLIDAHPPQDGVSFNKLLRDSGLSVPTLRNTLSTLREDQEINFLGGMYFRRNDERDETDGAIQEDVYMMQSEPRAPEAPEAPLTPPAPAPPAPELPARKSKAQTGNCARIIAALKETYPRGMSTSELADLCQVPRRNIPQTIKARVFSGEITRRKQVLGDHAENVYYYAGAIQATGGDTAGQDPIIREIEAMGVPSGFPDAPAHAARLRALAQQPIFHPTVAGYLRELAGLIEDAGGRK